MPIGSDIHIRSSIAGNYLVRPKSAAFRGAALCKTRLRCFEAGLFGEVTKILRPTDTANASLPFCVAEFETVTEGLDYAARGETGCNFFSSRGDLTQALSYHEIRERSIAAARRLAALKLPRGSRVALIAETTPEFLTFFYGAMYAGLIPVPLPLSINLGGHESYVRRLRAMLQAGSASVAVASEELIDLLREAAQPVGVKLVGTPDDILGLPEFRGEIDPLGKDEGCYIQYSSGSTSMPRGVLATQRAVTSNARGIGQFGLELCQGDRSTSWLPLYHDMGLVGFCITPMLSQVSVDYVATSAFARRPLIWLKMISEQRSTISFSPTFGYDLCLRRSSNAGAESYDLSSWRVAGIGGEMVRPDVIDRFAQTFAASGFDRKAFLPSYGLAESTLAVSFPPLGTGLRVDHVQRNAYEKRGEAVPALAKPSGTFGNTRSFAICGSALPGHEIEIRDAAGKPLPDRRIGRICIKGPSIMQAYFKNEGASRIMQRADGWLDTGDMGYMVDGELVVTGRSKDLIICNGRNIWPQDLEWAVEKHPGLRAGCVAAFSVDDEDAGERVVIVCECRLSDPNARRALLRDIVLQIRKTAGVDCEVVLVPVRSLTFTSSGKLSRAAAKANYLCDSFERLSIVSPATLVRQREAYLPASAAG